MKPAGYGLAWLFGRFPRLAAEQARLVVGASLLLMLAQVFVGSGRLELAEFGAECPGLAVEYQNEQ